MSDCLECNQNKNTIGSEYSECLTCKGDSDKCTSEIDSVCVIYHPDNDTPSKLENLNLPNMVSAEKIFETIDDLLGTNFNIPITVKNTSSIDLTASDAANHTIKADLKVSTDLGNSVEIRNNGVFAKTNDGKVKIDQNGIPKYLENQLVGGTDGCVSVNIIKNSDILQIMPDLNIPCLLEKLSITTNNILSSTSNIMTSVVNGVSSSTNIINANVLTIDSGNGNLTSTINGVASTVPVGISPALTASNGLTKIINNVALGGILSNNTSILSSGNGYNLGINKLVVGNLSDLTTNKYPFSTISEYSPLGVSDFYMNHYSATTINLDTPLGFVFGSGHSLGLNVRSNQTLSGAYNVAVYGGTLYLASTLTNSTINFGNTNVNHPTPGMGMISTYSANTVLLSNTATNSRITNVANFYSLGLNASTLGQTNPTKITNFFGMFLANASVGADSLITNRYGIYQEGRDDKNRFYGELELGGSDKGYGETSRNLITTTTNYGTITHKLKIKINNQDYFIPLNQTAL